MGHDKLFQKRKAVLTRLQNTRKLRRILIVCEGEKTEPNYFRKFPANPEVYDGIDVYGTGYNTVSLINEAIRIKKLALKKRNPTSKLGVFLIKMISLSHCLRMQ
jgi:hypothetical protein